MLIRDCNGGERNVEDGDGLTIYSGTSPFSGHVMTFKEMAWLKVNNKGRKEFLSFNLYTFNPSSVVPTREEATVRGLPHWEVGATYRNRMFPERGFSELIAEEGVWLSFRKISLDGEFISLYSTRKSEQGNLEKVMPPLKQYDPSQQPWEEGDI